MVHLRDWRRPPQIRRRHRHLMPSPILSLQIAAEKATAAEK